MASFGSTSLTNGPAPAPPRDRRAKPRHKVRTPAYASLNGTSAGMVLDLSEILDISEDGMSIQTSAPLRVATSLNLCLDLAETKSYIHTTGYVVWTNNSGRAGIRFPGMPQSSLAQLQHWMALNAVAASANQLAEGQEQTGAKQRPSTAEPPTPPSPDYSSVLLALGAVDREVDSLGANFDAALQLIAERARGFTHASGAAIALSERDEMVCCATAGPDAPPMGARLHVGSGFSGECVRTGRLLRCDDTETDPVVDRESCRALGIRSMVAVPIRLGGSVIGLLEVFSPAPRSFSDTENAVLSRLSETIVAAANRSLRAETIRDRPVEAPSIIGKETQIEPASEDKPLWLEPSPSNTSRIVIGMAVAVLIALGIWFIVPAVKSWLSPGQSVAVPAQPASAPKQQTAPPAGDLPSLKKLAEQGDAAAAFAVGAHYATGDGVAQDYPEAVKWFLISADHGHIAAQATLGAYYWAGRGVQVDIPKAYFWSVLAQAGGDEASKYRVAVLSSRMTRAQVLAIQQEANDWIKKHQLSSRAAQ